MEKPGKYDPPDCRDDIVWNEAIEEYEKYHNWKMSQLPDEEEITSIIGRCLINNMTSKMIAKIVMKRIGKEKR